MSDTFLYVGMVYQDRADEIERLRRWKAGAITVIKDWEAVWEAAGFPGVLGQTKSLGLLGELSRLDDEIKRLRAEVGRLTDELQQVASEIALAESEEARRER